MEHLISIVDKQLLKMKDIFESDLLTSSYNSVLKGYQNIFLEFVSSLKASDLTEPPFGNINVDPYLLSVTHLWPKVKTIICNIKQFIKALFKIFVVEEGNCQSPSSVDMDSPGDLIKLIQDFFHTTKRYLRGKPIFDDSKNQLYNGGNE